jgi:signal transduction histidine kinase
MFARALTFLNSLSASVLTVSLVGLTLVVGYFDYLAGTDTTFSAIYLFPIGAAAWFLGRPIVYALAVLSSILWVTGDIAAGARYPSVFIPLWNLAARFAVFIFAAELVAGMRELHLGMEKRAVERAAKLTAEIAMRERLERELLQISEREQLHVGHDIHDSLCQQLTGTAFAAQVHAESLKSQGSSDAASAFKLVHLIEDSIFLARNLARGLSGVELANNGLTAALTDFASTTSELFKISCRFEGPHQFPMDHTDTAVHLYRIAQEAVGNAVKHGEAKNILIELNVSKRGKLLRITDDGTGLRTASTSGKGMGLRIMAYRSELIGAKFDIRGRGTGGTVLTCLLPAEEAAAP